MRDSDTWFQIMTDIDCQMILEYLKDNNPDVSIEELIKRLKMKKNIVDEKLNLLQKQDFIKEGSEGWELTEYGRFIVNKNQEIRKQKHKEALTC